MSPSNRTYAIISGASLIIMGVTAGFSYGYVHGELIIPTDPQTTLANLQNTTSLFASGIFGWLIILVADLLVSWSLYMYFKATDKSMAIYTGGIRVVYSIFLAFAIFQLTSVMQMSPSENVDAQMVMAGIEDFELIWSYGLFIFGLHLIGLGYLSIKSKEIPKWMGWLLYIAGASYSLISGAEFLAPNAKDMIVFAEAVLGTPMAIAELGLAIWLLWKGGKSTSFAPRPKFKIKASYLIVFALLLSSNLKSQELTEFRVYLKDKGSSIEMFDTPQMFLSHTAIERRELQNVSIRKNDLPIASEYKAELKRRGATILAQSKWLNYVYIRHDNPKLIQSMPFVNRIEFPMNCVGRLSSSRDLDSMDYGFARGQIEMLNGHLLHQEGFTGLGINIAVIDAGYDGFNQSTALDSLRNSDRLLGTYNFITDNSEVFSGWGSHGTSVLSMMAAHLPDTMIGTAPHANYWLLTTENINEETPLEMDHWVMAAEFADSAGAHVINTSLSYRAFDNPQDNLSYNAMDGNSTLITKAADLAASKGILVVASAGNDGETNQPHISAPADGDSVLTVGAVNWLGNYWSYSSIGPSADGRTKPDFVAQGSPVTLVDGSGEVNIEFGTSFAAPIVTGLAACVIQAYPTRHSEEVAEAIRLSSSDYSNPTDTTGFGLPDFQRVHVLSTPEYVYQTEELKVYPNPMIDHLVIDARDGNDWSALLRIFDIGGRCVFTKQLNTKSIHRINVDLVPGRYVLKLSGDMEGAYKFQRL